MAGGVQWPPPWQLVPYPLVIAGSQAYPIGTCTHLTAGHIWYKVWREYILVESPPLAGVSHFSVLHSGLSTDIWPVLDYM